MNEYKKSSLEGRYLTFYVDGELYGLELSHVIEIVSTQPTAHLPHVPAYMRGVINLRGRIVPVLDVRLKLKKPAKADDEKTCFIIVAYNDFRVGVIVDEVAEVCSVADHQLSEPPLQQLSDEKYLQSIADLGDRVVRNLDCERFFAADLYADGIRPASQEEG
ncbi:MAG: chemotaxis protein CheW [Oscillospiraceae bacterium]|nr:chemotaxis protein CheW [Oscillospiraceae bacterium]